MENEEDKNTNINENTDSHSHNSEHIHHHDHSHDSTKHHNHSQIGNEHPKHEINNSHSESHPHSHNSSDIISDTRALTSTNSDETIKKRTKSVKKILFGWVEDNYDKIFLLVVAVAFVIRLLIFLKTQHQPLWWDAGDYLSSAKRIGLGLEIKDIWYYRRGFFWLIFPAFFYATGLGEIGIRFSEVLFSTGIVIVSYFLIKEMFNKRLALLTSVALTFSWIILFFTARPLTSIPATFFLLLSLLFFWKGHINDKGMKFYYLFAIFFTLAILTRMQYLMFAPAFLVIIFLKEKFRFLLNKKLWITLIVIGILMIPMFYMWTTHFGNPIVDILGHYFGADIKGATSVTPRTTSTLFNYIKDFPYMLTTPIFYLFIIGFFMFFADVILGFDKIFTNKKIQMKVFIFVWIFVSMLVLGYITQLVEQRYAIPSLTFIYLIAIYPLVPIGNYLRKSLKLGKNTIVLISVLVLVLLLIPNYNWGQELITQKQSSYAEVKQAGEWIKENSNPSDVIVTASVPQITYYAERSVSHIDQIGNQSTFLNDLIELNPKYVMLSLIEQTQQYTYETVVNNPGHFTPVWIFPPNSEQPHIVIYQFNQFPTPRNQAPEPPQNSS